MKLLSLFFILSSLLCQAQVLPTTPLFNGKNLDGWYMISQDDSPGKNYFGVKDKAIHAYPNQTADSKQPFAAIITEKEYENYVLKFEYKWGDKKFAPRENEVRDAGVVFHIFGELVIWPSGIECQIQEGDSGDLWIIQARASSKVDGNGNNYSPEGTLITKGEKNTYSRISRINSWEHAGWNNVMVTVNGNNAKFFINGKLVNEAINMQRYDENTKAWLPLTKGQILLQAEGSEVFYRNITIQDLKK
ncbi:3-keto-disaccharide hydrolase [Arcticibacterium luteifluviistationis]|uniref:3-keto-alpha-glucoside-1,2-lyase/3-keto-2-hydroxy-glucal hydratase domain-containing protein n=1 Tax=Arcticibacterium luteifluviistationis TaxID=1784714 RepID=A0A2Z4G9Q6_9BACT|nr:DUF1080 domain-containing protein [Arcticibacterium luteifluviistationis]AWV97947.1 hypothetical protein DJ013_07100 [Arcticibacterium luteifluviistationis]